MDKSDDARRFGMNAASDVLELCSAPSARQCVDCSRRLDDRDSSRVPIHRRAGESDCEHVLSTSISLGQQLS